ncbi:MAG TPA: replicative DNA helicase [Candidatus Paceibacterota bacterium]|nr:replicative DNA helicase [Candidatus Paceibacterota bacterium]
MADIPMDKLPPQNLDAERHLLGALLVDPDAINRVLDVLTPEDFYQRNHQLIFRSVMDLFEDRNSIDILSVSGKLTDKKELEQIGGVGYLTSLANEVSTSAHVATYARIVRDKRVLRQLIDTAHRIIALGHKEDEDVEHLLDEAEQLLFGVAQRGVAQKFGDLAAELELAIERIQNIDSGQLRGLPTNHSRLDGMLGGLQKSDLIILAARPSVGKTAFAIDIARRVAAQNIPVGIFSMEMSMDQVIDRFIASQGRTSLWKLRTGRLSHEGEDNDFVRITSAISDLKDMPIHIDDSQGLNVLQMRAMARRLKLEKGLGLLVVDYLQLMSARRSYDSAVQQVTEISRGLKGLAKELQVPVIALSQLSRAPEQRGGDRPRLSDLRDSGSIEQDADVVMFIHREDKINRAKAQEAGLIDQGQLVIAKHRNGPTGEIDYYINPDTLEFTEIDRSHNDADFL